MQRLCLNRTTLLTAVLMMLMAASLSAQQTEGSQLPVPAPPEAPGSVPPQEPQNPPSPNQPIASARILEEIQGDVLQVVIAVRVKNASGEVVWNMDMDELTVPGRGVRVKLNGENILVDAEFTPYRQEDEMIILVVQGQTWIRNEDDDKVRYQTTLKSIPVLTGEPALYYPLGLPEENSERISLELEIVVRPYSQALTQNPEVADTAESAAAEAGE